MELGSIGPRRTGTDEKDPELEANKGCVDDSGEGRWTVVDAIGRGVSATVLAPSPFARCASRQRDAFSNKFIAALRNEFGRLRGQERVTAHGQ